jgi:hypothetical protein
MHKVNDAAIPVAYLDECLTYTPETDPSAMSNPFRFFNSSPEVIRLGVTMYVSYPLSLRTAERDKAAALKFLKRIMTRYGRRASSLTGFAHAPWR